MIYSFCLFDQTGQCLHYQSGFLIRVGVPAFDPLASASSYTAARCSRLRTHALFPEWNRKRSVTEDELEEQHKLTFGMLFSLNVRRIASAARIFGRVSDVVGVHRNSVNRSRLPGRVKASIRSARRTISFRAPAPRTGCPDGP